jgi:RNA polymerase sigma factor (sigma-70 family)
MVALNFSSHKGDDRLVDFDLINRCKKGDIEAFGLLVEKYNEMAVRTAFMVTGRGDICDDIAQEAFILCFHSLKSLKNAEFFNTWFYKILVRTSWKMASKYKNNVSVDTSEMEGILGVFDDNNPASIVETEFLSLEISKSIEKLSLPLKTVVVLYYYNGFTIKEISKILDCGQNTVKSRLHKARKKLEEILLKSNFDIDNQKDVEKKGDGLDGKSSAIRFIDKKILSR